MRYNLKVLKAAKRGQLKKGPFIIFSHFWHFLEGPWREAIVKQHLPERRYFCFCFIVHGGQSKDHNTKKGVKGKRRCELFLCSSGRNK
jgi:hypothetical protein